MQSEWLKGRCAGQPLPLIDTVHDARRCVLRVDALKGL